MNLIGSMGFTGSSLHSQVERLNHVIITSFKRAYQIADQAFFSKESKWVQKRIFRNKYSLVTFSKIWEQIDLESVQVPQFRRKYMHSCHCGWKERISRREQLRTRKKCNFSTENAHFTAPMRGFAVEIFRRSLHTANYALTTVFEMKYRVGLWEFTASFFSRSSEAVQFYFYVTLPLLFCREGPMIVLWPGQSKDALFPRKTFSFLRSNSTSEEASWNIN